MPRAEPRLQSKLMVWLLGPLLMLLVLDTVVTYRSSVDFSNQAYDRSPQEIGREVAWHVHANAHGKGPVFEITAAAERNLLIDTDATDAVQLQPLDLKDLALSISMDWVPLAIKQGVDLGFDGPGQPLLIDAEPDRLRELVNNLIDNAVRYSARNGRVTVAVGRSADGRAQLAIGDDGPAIPVHERSRIFERFHLAAGRRQPRFLSLWASGPKVGPAMPTETRMAVTDPSVTGWIADHNLVHLMTPGLCAVMVVATGKWLTRRAARRITLVRADRAAA